MTEDPRVTTHQLLLLPALDAALANAYLATPAQRAAEDEDEEELLRALNTQATSRRRHKRRVDGEAGSTARRSTVPQSLGPSDNLGLCDSYVTLRWLTRTLATPAQRAAEDEDEEELLRALNTQATSRS
jgi:hypothetical protein